MKNRISKSKQHDIVPLCKRVYATSIPIKRRAKSKKVERDETTIEQDSTKLQ